MVRNLATLGWFAVFIALLSLASNPVLAALQHDTGIDPPVVRPLYPQVVADAARGADPVATWQKKSFKEWLRSPSAVLTPELTQLGLEIAIERGREHLDRFAYEIVKALLRALTESYPVTLLADVNATRESRSIARLAKFVTQLVEPKLSTISELSVYCKQVFAALDKKSARELSLLFGGAMKLTGAETDDEVLAHPFWNTLKDQSCNFRGYVDESTRPEVWKFWISRTVLASVLPRDSHSISIQNRLTKDVRIIENAGKLDTYASWRGKPNGLSLKAASDARKDVSDRRTGGRFIGTTAVSLLADYSTQWEEQILKDFHPETLWPTEGTPDGPLSLEPLFEAMPSNFPSLTAKTGRIDPAFDIGLVFWWKRVREPVRPPYGESNRNYARSAGAYWLASVLDGFSAHHSWTDALTLDSEANPIAPDCCTRKVTGPSAAYAISSYAYESSMKSLEPAIDVVKRSGYDEKTEKYWNEVRENWLEGFNLFRTEAFKGSNGDVVELPQETVKWWGRVDFGTTISSLGTFTSDPKLGPGAPKEVFVQVGQSPTGYARPVTINGKKYEIWAPQSYIIVGPNPLSAKEWKKLVQERGL